MTMRGKKAGETDRVFGNNRRDLVPRTEQGKRVSEGRRKATLSGRFSGRVVNNNGYCRVKMACHPRAISGYAYEHIVAGEMCLGRPLNVGEIVHHVDGDKTNSHYKNLLVFPTQGHHVRFHVALRKGAKDTKALRRKHGAISFTKKPSLPSGGPHWMRSLVDRIIYGPECGRALPQ